MHIKASNHSKTLSLEKLHCMILPGQTLMTHERGSTLSPN